MAKERIVYDKSFKENAVKLSYERKSVAELSRELGISSQLIDRWRKEFESFGSVSFPGNGIAKMTPEEKQVAELKERIRQIEWENEILTKAMHIFSRDIR